MLKKYKDKNKMYIQGIHTWKELVNIVIKAKEEGYSYMGYDNIKGVGFAAVFKKTDKKAKQKE